jgi:hypothetical protein
MAQPHKPGGDNDEDFLAIIKSQQGTINELVALAQEQIKVIGELVSAEPDKRAAVVTGLEARLAATAPK